MKLKKERLKSDAKALFGGVKKGFCMGAKWLDEKPKRDMARLESEEKHLEAVLKVERKRKQLRKLRGKTKQEDMFEGIF